MIDITIDLTGNESLERMLERGMNPDDAIARSLGQWATELLDERLYGMRNYAPPPPNSTYIRTGRLGANWGLSRPGKTQVEFYNMTSYAGYVVGDRAGQNQAAIHAGRWWLARQRIEDGLDDAEEKIGKALTAELGL